MKNAQERKTKESHETRLEVTIKDWARKLSVEEPDKLFAYIHRDNHKE